ncbi:phage tail tape measure protein [Enterococcus faecium]|uniref:phage tail tape measure protein n=1 Tax=Enterococcus faecium TaxID=1352 RepID=UPI000C2738B9|nr:phage tail tape measure protein [Enterococcus faecium]PJO83621.1 phage tail tape measure protein [Enterococcus faecium]RXA59648.1 phage tail tape measure protein [Enterococcus faecium]RXA82088.1 phage tail tape measure protein [Enterococcus faecium]TBV28530.1 phage tail tape measure protein [Enterococcus faecium]TBV29603.1 phage tail tape measure protein [Enterococcus faecium]
MANGKPIGNMKVILDLDSSSFSKGLEGAKKSVAYNTKAMKAQMQVMNYSGDKVGALRAKYDGLSKTLSSNEKYMSKLKTQYDKSFDANGKATASTAKYANELNQAIAKSASYEAQMKTTTGQIARMKVETEGVTGKLKAQSDQWIKSGKKIESFGKKMSSIGSTLTMSVTAPIAAGFGLATKKAVDFQTQIGEIGPLLTNGGKMTTEYRNQLDQMSDSSKKWAKEYGVSTTEINTGLAEIVRKGYDANQTLGVMPSILDATKASGDDFNDVMNVTTEVISQFNLKGKDYNSTVKNATRVTDALTYVANATSAGFSDLGLAMGYVGPVANSLGMDVEETASAIGLLSDAGIGGEKAGTALRGALTRLLKPSKQNIAGFEQLGISVDEFKNGTLTLPDMLNKIKVNTEGWTDAQRTSAIALAFGTESQSAMNVLVNQGGDALKGLTKETYNANGATKEIAKSMNNLPANKLARFKESLNVLAITAGEKLLPIFTPIIEKTTKMINKFSELDDASQKNILKWSGIAAAAGPTLKLLGGSVAIFGKTKTAVGKLTGSLVELAAKTAEKKAMNTFASTVTAAGTAASSAAGASGVGAMTTSLGLLGPALLGVVGVGGALALGYGAWKTFGEEAWNSAQRTKEWGTDVGKATDEALEKVKGYGDGAIGEFGLIEQGLSDNTGAMAGNFEKMGKSIETEMTNRIKTLKELVKGLPKDIQDAADDLTDDEIDKQEEYLKIVQENNDRITQIKENASKNGRKISYEESVIVKALAEESATAYVNSLGKSKDETKKILDAMTGNVGNATQDQAKSWLESLGKQRQNSKIEYSKMQEDMKKHLVDAGYDLNSSYAKQMFDLLEKSSKSATELTEDQMSLILGKYPELAQEVFLANGQLISSMGDAGQSAVEQNKKMIETFGDMSRTAAKTAEENAKKIDLISTEATEVGEFWNNLVLEEKTGEVKTNAQEAINEAAKSEAGWNKLIWASKKANLSSNAKLMIAEAAIANGKWDKMTFTDQQALIESNVTKTITQAVQAKGDWENLTFDQKKALLYSNTPEIMAETLLNLGYWDEYQPEIKELNAKNYNFLTTLSKSEEKLASWNGLPTDVKEIIGDNYDFLNKIYSSEENFARWNSIPDSEKKLLADNMDFLTKISTSKETLNQWNQLPTDQKNILANNEDLLNKIFASEESFNAWKAIPDPVKRMLGDNVDILTKVKDGTISIEDYNKNVLPLLKKLFGDNSSLTGAVGDASATIDNYNKNVFLNDKTAVGHDEASQAAKDAFEAFNIFQTKIPDKITKTVSADFIGPMPKNAKGTNFHPGGAAMVNDQKGSTYEELVTLPNGEAFIPKGRNVVLDLPRGSKVLKATKTKRLVPKYADGIGNITTISTAPNFDALILAINELTAVLRSQQPISNQSTTDTKVAQPIIPDALSEKSDQYLAIGSEWLTNLMNGWNSVVPQYMSSETLFITNYLNALKSQNNPSYLQGATWNKNLMNGWNSLTGTFIATINSFCNQAMVTLRNYNTPMYNNGRTWQQNNLNGWNSLYGSFIARVNQLGNDSINNLRSKNGGFYNAGSFLLQSLINGMNSMSNSLASTMNSVANTMVGGMGKGVNGVISGVNYVLKEVESSKSIGNWPIPQYAKGTEGHPGGLAMINDQKGLVHEEYVQMPDGRGFIAKGRDLLVNLPKGAQVLNASLTKKLKERLNVPQYENGVGNLDIVDLLDDEKRMLEFLTSKVDFSGINEQWLDMTKSGTSLMSKAANTMLQSKLSEFFTHGNFDGAVNANGVYQYLVDVAQKVMGKFPGLTVTSGYRAGDAYYHGKRQAIDLAYPGISGDPRYTAAANYAFEKFPSKIAYVITNGRVRDRMGLSGTGSSGQWTNWPDGDHFDHIHLNGSMGSGDISNGGVEGSGVARWRSYVSKALKMNGLPATAAYINAWMSQIQTESGGNEKAIGGNDGLAEGNATGLLQTKPGTFAANAFPGHGNIMNGFDNMLAAINYAKKRYGVAGMLQVIGKGHGYANGGLITKDGLYRAGEGNKPEMVIPLTRKTRAIELMGQALAFLSGDDKKRSNTANTADNSAELITLIKQQQKQHNELMMILRAILGKDLSLKSSDIGQAANHYMGSDLNKLRYANGGV